MAYLQEKASRIAYLKGMIRLSKVDGEVSGTEVSYIETAAKGMGLGESEIAELLVLFKSESTVKLEFIDKGDAVFFIQEAIQFCSVDGTYDEKEHSEIRRIAAEIGIAESDVMTIENWVSEGVAWKRRGEVLVEDIISKK